MLSTKVSIEFGLKESPNIIAIVESTNSGKASVKMRVGSAILS